MLPRRCRLILVIDADADPDCTFQDLGNALRKAAIDLRVRVAFDTKPQIQSRNSVSATDQPLGFATATILYDEMPEKT
jgi:hypothetical protein